MNYSKALKFYIGMTGRISLVVLVVRDSSHNGYVQIRRSIRTSDKLETTRAVVIILK